jgi:hypothetical protein
MKRRDVITLLGFLSLVALACCGAIWRPVWRPAPNEHIARTVAAVADPRSWRWTSRATELGLHTRILAMPDLDVLLTGSCLAGQQAVAQGVSTFALDEARRLAAVDAAFASNEDGTQHSSRCGFIWARPTIRSPWSRRLFSTPVRRSRTGLPISGTGPHER